jgi:hypothetical protein
MCVGAVGAVGSGGGEIDPIPIKIAYTVLQRLCDVTLRMSQNTDYMKPIALRMYGG